MKTSEFIPVDLFCRQHHIEASFLSSLGEYGLVQIARIEETECIPADQLVETERLIRLHRDLDVNIEGIDVITHLLDRVHTMQDEIRRLRNRLGIYE